MFDLFQCPHGTWIIHIIEFWWLILIIMVTPFKYLFNNKFFNRKGKSRHGHCNKENRKKDSET